MNRAGAAMTQLVMFDIDGTLVDSHDYDGALLAEAIHSELGAPVDTTWASYRNVTDSGIVAEILQGRDLQQAPEDAASRVERRFVELLHSHLERHPAALREIAGAAALITALLAEPAVRVAIATGGWEETAHLKLRGIGLDPRQLTIATASDALARTRIMQIAEQRAMQSMRPARKTYFGDGIWDKRASEALGYDFVAVGPRVAHHQSLVDLSDHRAVFELLDVPTTAA